jgi:hypothetical protein
MRRLTDGERWLLEQCSDEAGYAPQTEAVKEACIRLESKGLAQMSTRGPFWFATAAGRAAVEAVLAEREAHRLYAAETANDPIIHCNRFPAWSELSAEAKQPWLDRARRREPTEAVLAEREACARIAEEIQKSGQGMLAGSRIGAVHEGACLEIAAAIRARSGRAGDGSGDVSSSVAP